MSSRVDCIQNSRITKSRKEFVQSMKDWHDLKQTKGNSLYFLTHTYNVDPNRKLYVAAPYDYETINAIIAYIQFECTELDNTYSMDESEVIEILEKFYECRSSFSAVKEEVKKAKAIDLYINWESHCGSKVQTVEFLERDGMKVMLQEYVDKFNKKHGLV